MNSWFGATPCSNAPRAQKKATAATAERTIPDGSLLDGGCANHVRYDGGCKATSSRERATSNRWSISRSGTRTATPQSHWDVWRWTLRVVAADWAECRNRRRYRLRASGLDSTHGAADPRRSIWRCRTAGRPPVGSHLCSCCRRYGCCCPLLKRCTAATHPLVRCLKSVIFSWQTRQGGGCDGDLTQHIEDCSHWCCSCTRSDIH